MAIALAGVLCLAPVTAYAHKGPPFPIMMDSPAGQYAVSVWADPDIGEATFYILVETREGGPPEEEPTVTLWTEPVSGRLERAEYKTWRQYLRNRMQFEAHPHFDTRDQWQVGFRITPANGEPQEVRAQVESTPPGWGWWDLGIYLFPFAFLGGFWIYGMIRHRRRARTETAPAAAVACTQSSQ